MVNPTLQVSTAISVSLPGIGKVNTALSDAQLAHAVTALKAARGADVMVPDQLVPRLKKLGILVSPRRAPKPLAFRCALERGAEKLIPGRQAGALNYDREIPVAELRVNPAIFSAAGGEVPRRLASRVGPLSKFSREGRMIWVDDPGPGILMPYWLTPECEAALRDVSRGAADRQPAELLELLRRAHVLVPPGFVRDRRREWEKRGAEWKSQLRREGYAVLTDLFNPVQLAALRAYYRSVLAEGYMVQGDTQVPKRWVWHNEPISRFLHGQLSPLVNRVTPERVKPSYAYLAVYKPGAELKKHIDREQCVWNLSIPFDARPETDRRSAWPIYLEIKGRKVKVCLGLGDGLIYRGAKTPHWREPQPKGHTSTVCFFHFVEKGFKGKLT